MPWNHFAQQVFDKLVLVVVLAVVMVFAFRDPHNAFYQHVADQVCGALLVLLTGAAARAVGPSPPPTGITNQSSVVTTSSSHRDVSPEDAAAEAEDKKYRD